MKYNHDIVTAYFRSQNIPAPVFEHRFHPVRMWRFDMSWVGHKVYLEVDGGIWLTGKKKGGHNRGAQMKKDWEKRNTAAGMGWRGILCEPKDLMTMKTVEFIKAALEV